jgi:hypothetical protein
LGEDGIIERRKTNRKRETAFCDSDDLVTLELSRNAFQRVKEVFYQMSLKKDYLSLEAVMKRSLFLKRNFTLLK